MSSRALDTQAASAPSRFCRPSMTQDVIRYVRSCLVCAISKTPRQFPSGKLVPLLVPRRPRSLEWTLSQTYL
ncbi:Transposon Tf2-9 polyprotein [Labeo rohita]|uniref:Transposon Tf2-9 polyprotein n=1 Tax=Labeo rohita TaxID=84645 RepID=A0ABQ8L4X9_LABRO|nr:Transposon Tf2-9 polyprotein [Labeo rohita]